MDKLFKIAEIIAKEKTGTLSDIEKEELQQWLAESEQHHQLYQKLQSGAVLFSDLDELKQYDAANAFRNVEKAISSTERKAIRIPAFAKYAAAFLLLITASYFIVKHLNRPAHEDIATNAIVPGSQKAILITADNREVTLDSASHSKLIEEAQAQIIQQGSSLTYSNVDSLSKQNEIAYNTLKVPRGGTYKIILSDGTEVMLNSESQLRYPVVFSGDSRQVELLGEAFFKVKKSNHQLFIVSSADMQVSVYGTVFNVSAYNNEDRMHTTLVEGSVGMRINNLPERKIVPGQQCEYARNSGEMHVKSVDVEQFTAWTNNKFVFENESIENILKTMSRWYNFDFKFKNENLKNQRFTLSLSRYDQFSKILEMLALSSDVKFSVEGNTVIVE